MKAFIKSMKFTSVALLFLALAACGKSDDNNNNVAAVQYGYQNGQCYDITHNTPAQYNLCTGVGTTGQFSYVNGQCVSVANNQVVDPTYCSGQYGQGQYPGQYGQYPGQYGQYPGQYGYPQGCNSGSYGYGYNPSYGIPCNVQGGGYQGSMNCAGRTMMTQWNGYAGSFIQCDAYGCRGQFLYDVNTKLRVYCQ